MKPPIRIRVLAAAALAACATPALAGTLQLTHSSAELAVRAYAGVAIVDANLPCEPLEFPDEIEECSVGGTLDLVVTDAAPGMQAIGGSATAHASESLWSAWMTLSWNTWQSYAWASSGADLVLSGGGGHSSTIWSEVAGPAVPPGFQGTRQVTVQNQQTLIFTLDSATHISYSGSAFGEYMPVLLARQDGSGLFVDEGNIPESFSGTLAAGTYRLRNFFLLQTEFETDWSYGWNYSLSFHDTLLAVPEPPPPLLMTAGLAAIGWLGRRRGLGMRA